MAGKLGKYQVFRTLGVGASCKVKLALDSTSGDKVAIKIMRADLDDVMKHLIMTEVKAMD